MARSRGPSTAYVFAKLPESISRSQPVTFACKSFLCTSKSFSNRDCCIPCSHHRTTPRHSQLVYCRSATRHLSKTNTSACVRQPLTLRRSRPCSTHCCAAVAHTHYVVP